MRRSWPALGRSATGGKKAKHFVVFMCHQKWQKTFKSSEFRELGRKYFWIMFILTQYCHATQSFLGSSKHFI